MSLIPFGGQVVVLQPVAKRDSEKEAKIKCYCAGCERGFEGRAAAAWGDGTDGYILLAISGMCPYCGEFVMDWKGKIPVLPAGADIGVVFDPKEG